MRADEGRPVATGRPSEDAAAKPLFEAESTATTDRSVGTQFRRRRAAAKRLEPMEDGRHDPLELADRRDRWSGSRRLHVEIGPRHTAWLHGGRLKGLCERANVPHL